MLVTSAAEKPAMADSTEPTPTTPHGPVIFIGKETDGDMRVQRTSQLPSIPGLRNSVEIVQVADGGRIAWSTALGSWLIQIATFGYTNSFGVYQDFYVRTYLSSSTASRISWIGSTQLLILLGSGLFTGQALDRGYFYYTSTIGTVLFCLSLFMLSLTQPQHYYQIFLSQAIGIGLGAGLLFVPSIAIIAHHFKRRRSLVLGLVATGSGIGGVIHPIMLDRLIFSQGFRRGVLASAALNTGLLILALALMRTSLPVKKQSFAQQFSQFKGLLREREFCFTAIAAFVINLGLFFPLFYLQTFSLDHNAGPVVSFYTLSSLNAASIFGRLIPNLFVDRFGIFNMMTILAVASTALIFGMAGLSSVASILVFSILYGYIMGSIIGISPPMVASFAKDPSEIGVRTGIVYSLNALASLIGPPITGALLTSNNHWIRPIIFSGACFALSTAVFAFLRHLIAQRRQSPWV